MSQEHWNKFIAEFWTMVESWTLDTRTVHFEEQRKCPFACIRNMLVSDSISHGDDEAINSDVDAGKKSWTYCDYFDIIKKRLILQASIAGSFLLKGRIPKMRLWVWKCLGLIDTCVKRCEALLTPARTYPWTNEVRAGWLYWPGTVWKFLHRENELTRNSSGNARQQSSQLAEPLWTDPWPKEWNWCARADLHFKRKRKKKKRKKSEGGERFVEPSPVILASGEKPITTTTTTTTTLAVH